MNRPMPFYLFLDFDGVLHAVGDGAVLFEHADRLGAALAALPHIRVVVSSSWREIHPLDELRAFCGPVLGDRLAGVTPVFRRRVEIEKPRVRLRVGGHAALLRRDIDPTRPFFERFEEISAWLALHAPANPHRPPLDRDDWLAIDDSDFWFPPACSQLLHVAEGRGLDDTHFDLLEARLSLRTKNR